MEAFKQMIMTQFKSNDPADYERVKAYIEDYMMRCLSPDEHAVQTMFNKLKQKPYTWDKENTWIPEGGGMRPHPWDDDVWDK